MSQERPTSRREFLRGQSAAEAVERVIDARFETGTDEAGAATAEPYLIRIGRQAMACEFEVILNAGQYADGTEIAIAALDLVEALEAQLTVYRDSSEVTAINASAAQEWVAVEARLYELLKLAVRLFAETDGAYDVTSGPLSKAWGFYRRQGAIPADEALAAALARVGSDKLAFDDDAQALRFAQEGIELNLGGIGKGYALDRVAEFLIGQGVRDFLLHGGQSSVLARGTQAGSTAPGWPVGIRDPLRPARRLAEARLCDRALGTSGAAAQFFRHDGRRYGHILDPRTGWPAEGMLNATAIAATGAEADALATAFYVLGVEKSLEYCRRRPDVGAILIPHGGAAESRGLAQAGIDPASIRLFGPGTPRGDDLD